MNSRFYTILRLIYQSQNGIFIEEYGNALGWCNYIVIILMSLFTSPIASPLTPSPLVNGEGGHAVSMFINKQ
jgi:hypothetical protein